ncbi:MAG: BadF/BadG/BcrA/BcrD ATPase family protein [Candidatus Pacebacteria bacterium]|nr:BadF/BadG/BcrA/BcrD ATPase family protein [Candidatus Paceibacterota bacterium]
MIKVENKYIIGVDGGGTKTVAAISDLEGKILKTKSSGPSNPHNVGIKNSANNIFNAINDWVKKRVILSIFIGLAGVEEDEKIGKLVKKEILKKIKNFKGKLIVGSDQIVAFSAGSNKEDGIILIAGTGCVAHGWKGNKEVKASGWGWLADEGSAFWVGQKVFQKVLKDSDGRPFDVAQGKAQKTLLTKEVFSDFKVRNPKELMAFVYANPIQIIPKLSIICDKVSKKGDKVSIEIMQKAGRELAASANTVIKKLDFREEKFPLILAGGMFKSEIILDTVKKEIKKFAPRAEFIQLKEKPVLGAVKLAIKEVRDENR